MRFLMLGELRLFISGEYTDGCGSVSRRCLFHWCSAPTADSAAGTFTKKAARSLKISARSRHNGWTFIHVGRDVSVETLDAGIYVARIIDLRAGARPVRVFP
ncbi:hypothetical protein BN2475_50124 [Paraburkholderia ribeironis]|uniref:Uncharacterized protein n=1 Tax=Paraburkholderia ribeironis TaxID=1247936 RepID=A0A1N7RLM2_9BURK|nr:hypothetical protein BN2475_50124 [Paraburkholderia ribeironis]